MPSQTSEQTTQSAALREKQIQSLIRKLKQKIQKIEPEAEVTPRDCHIIRYQVNRNQKLYYIIANGSKIKRTMFIITGLLDLNIR
ncbi:MAG: hypothetical protein F6K22_31690 [Okeania sp. SIO2F4]|uniref:hypothetical protein n=1 Tax=Okeania sp. SIO2F4 TaxID=2607790 RepID=UPI001428D8E6|nr:hypothetical protein [Okeania sp. SIO2F4]NES06967.1 hypothetical protein [Okeania sp. SIO2F4]